MKILKNFTDSYNTSILELVSWKATMARTFLGELRRYLCNFSIHKYKTLSKLKNARSGTAVICALGPSLYENKASTRELLIKASAKKSLFVINHFMWTEFSDIKPTFQFLGDDAFFYNEKNQKYVSKVESVPEVVVFTRMANSYKFRNDNIIYFSGLNFPTVLKGINPKSIVGFADFTILHSLAIALYMGYSRVIVCGFDNNRFMQINSVSPGEIYFKGIRPYDRVEVEKWGSRDTMIKILSSHLVILKSLLLFKNKKIFIVGESSLIDVFPKIDVRTAIGLLE